MLFHLRHLKIKIRNIKEAYILELDFFILNWHIPCTFDRKFPYFVQSVVPECSKLLELSFFKLFAKVCLNFGFDYRVAEDFFFQF